MDRNRALNAYAYEHIRDMIYNGKFEHDRVYSETRLAAELEVSRTPVRDALNRLMQERYIDILPNRGFKLHEPDYSDSIEAYHVRAMIETYCAEYLCQHRDDPGAMAAIDIMNNALSAQREMLEHPDEDTINRFWIQDLHFHKALLRYMNISSFNSQYESFLHIFMPQNLIDLADIEATRERAAARHFSTLTEHQAILDALEAGDAEGAKRAVCAHLETSLRALFRRIDR